MAGIIYSTELECDGPFLISEEDLFELDKVVDEVFQRMEDGTRREVLRKATELMEDKEFRSWHKDATEDELLKLACSRAELYLYNKHEKRITLLLRDKKKVEVASFKEASLTASISDSELQGIEVYLGSGVAQVSLTVKSGYCPVLRLNSAPEGHSDATEAFLFLRRWVDRFKPSIIMQWWLKYASILWLPILIIAFFSLSLMLREKSEDWAVMQKAHEYAQTGVPTTQQAEALQTLLAVTIGYKKPQKLHVIDLPKWMWGVYATIPFICVALYFPPKIVIEWGKGKKAYWRWRKWLKLMFVSIPLVLIGPKILDLIWNAMGI